MLRKFLLAVAPMLLVAGTVTADDSLLATIAKLDGTQENVQLEDEDTLGKADVDALLGENGEDSEEAIAACFRRIGYGYRYRSYRHSYSYYNPVCYNYSYVNHFRCYRPVTYSCYTPCYTSYWGCW